MWKKIQYDKEKTERTYTDKELRHHQAVCGKFTYGSRTVDGTMSQALNDLGIAATQGNDLTKKELQQLMYYVAINPDARVIFRASDMILL